jgi:hypothetical protein
LIGGLTLGIALYAVARLRHAGPCGQAAGMLAHRLPALMAFVINLGVPPLLFTQVLYGRALYTSSVLIGAYWISVIFLLMASYYGLYVAAKRSDGKKGWGGVGLASLLMILAIAFIYSNNMTLMLRPQSWGAMYHASPSGAQLNSADPSLIPRWFFFMAGAFPSTGAVLLLLGLKSGLEAGVKALLRRLGGAVIALTMGAQAVLAWVALGRQPQAVVGQVMADGFYRPFAYGWLATAGVLVILGLLAAGSRWLPGIVALASALGAFLNIVCEVLVRDGIRDYTLRAAGFEVWDRVVVTNWSVVGIFLVLFVAALATLGYLVVVLRKARPLEEKYV